MQAQQILNAAQSESVNTIGCTFTSTKYAVGHEKVYTYKTTMTHEVGDFVVIETVKGFQVVKVAEVHAKSQIDGQSTIPYKWVVCKVEQATYNSICDSEKKELHSINADLGNDATAVKSL